MNMRRVVITGMGVVSPLGCGIETVWHRLLAGQSGIRVLPDEIVGDLPAKIGGQVPTLAADPEAGFDPDKAVAPKDQKKMDWFRYWRLPLYRPCRAYHRQPWTQAAIPFYRTFVSGEFGRRSRLD